MPAETQDWRALPAGRELDALVAERLLGWRDVRRAEEMTMVGGDEMDGPPMELVGTGRFDWYGTAPGTGLGWRVPASSTDVAAAWQIVGAMYDRCCDFTLERANTDWYADFRTGQGMGDTAPLAICRAALAALEDARG